MTIPSAAVIALHDLSATWRQRIAVCQRISAAQAAEAEIRLAQAWDEEAAIVQRCADELDAVAGAAVYTDPAWKV